MTTEFRPASASVGKSDTQHGLFPYRTVVYWDDVETEALWRQTQELLRQAHIRHVDFFYIREHEIVHLDLDTVLPRIARIGGLADALMAEGVGCSIDLLPSLGWGHFIRHGPFEKYVGADGTESGVGACPLDPQLKDYLCAIAAAVAKTRVSFLGLDDDFQNDNHRPIRGGCYCPRHMHAFSQADGRTWTRQELVARLENDADLKQRWDRYRMSVLCDLAMQIMQAARNIRPDLKSFLTVGGDVGRNPSPVMQAMSAEQWRPFMGHYDDGGRFAPVMAAWIGQCQRIDWPRDVPTPLLLAEITSWPRNSFAKSWRTMMGQAALACFLGFDAPLFWSGQGRRDPGFIEALSSHRGWLDTLARAVADHPVELGLTVIRDRGEPLGVPPAMLSLGRMGFPVRLVTAEAVDAGPVFITTGIGPRAAACAASLPSLIDVAGIASMNAAVAAQLDLAVEPALDVPFSAEYINDHPLNGDGRGFHSVSLTLLKPDDHRRIRTSHPITPVAEYVDLQSGPILPSLMFIPDRRWVLAGYTATTWSRLVSHHKAAQLRAVMAKVFGKPLPVTAHGVDMFVFVRQSECSRLVLVMNCSFDPQPVLLTMDAPVVATRVADEQGRWHAVDAASCPVRGRSPVLEAHAWRLYRFEMTTGDNSAVLPVSIST